MRTNSAAFDPACQACPRLATHLASVAQQYPNYYAKPVAAFGVDDPDILIVGLAPGLHGANATGRPFTGDFAGILLYETLFEHGLSNQPKSIARDDGLSLHRCRITNAVKCLPPQNKPLNEEIVECNRYLRVEISMLRAGAVIIALGVIAHRAVLRALELKQASFEFSHCAEHELNSALKMVDSYHCSRYNTQTKRLTPAMFSAVFTLAVKLASEIGGPR